MKNFNCPHCHQPTIGFWRRQLIGPTAPAECSNCGAEVAMNWSGYWPLGIFAVIWAASEFVESSALYWAMNTVGLVLWFWLTNQFVPLVVKTPAPDPKVP